MGSKVSVSAMADAISELLEEYAADVADDMKAEVKKVASEASKELKKTSPVGQTSKGNKKSRHYREGWTTKVTKETHVALTVTVHNKTKYQLAHLLEKGHAKRGGGRVAGIPHIAPVEKEAEEKLLRGLEARL